MLNKAELLKQLRAGLQNFLAKDVFLSVDPEVGEAFLGGVKNFCEIAEGSFFVEDFVGLGEAFSVISVCAVGFEYFAEPLSLAEELLAGALPVLGVQVVLLVAALLQTVSHHHCVLQVQEVGRLPELLDLGQRPRRRGRGSQRENFREFEVVFAEIVRSFSLDALPTNRKSYKRKALLDGFVLVFALLVPVWIL